MLELGPGGLGVALPLLSQHRSLLPWGLVLPGPAGAPLESQAVPSFGMQDMRALLTSAELGWWFLRMLPH